MSHKIFSFAVVAITTVGIVGVSRAEDGASVDQRGFHEISKDMTAVFSRRVTSSHR